MRRTLGPALLLSLAALAVAEEARTELAWTVSETRDRRLVSQKHETTPPAGVEAIEDAGDVRYARRELVGGRVLLVAFRVSPAPVWVRVDRDLDGDLREEEPFFMTGAGSVRATDVEIDLGLELGEIEIRLVHHANPGSTCLHLSLPVHREGAVVLAGRRRRVALFDGNADLAFDDPARDRLLLDVDGDLDLERRTPSHEAIVPGTPFRIGDRGYVARVEKGSELVFEALTEPPPPAPRPWRRAGTPKAGVIGKAPAQSLGELVRELEKAEVADKKVGSTSFASRSRALQKIGQVGTPKAFQLLLRHARSGGNVNARAAALRATGDARYVAFAEKVTALARDSGHATIRSAALGALHGMNAPDRVELYAELVRSTGDQSLYSAAVRHLGYVATGPMLALLEEQAVSRSNLLLRRHAYQAATRYRTTPPPAALVMAAARSEDAFLRADGLADALALGLPEAPALAAEAMTSEEDRVRIAAVRILGAAGDPTSTRTLLDYAVSLSSSGRALAVRLLSAARRDVTTALLVERLTAPSSATRALAADVLAGIPGEASRTALIARLRTEKDGTVLAAVIRAVVAHGAKGAAASIVAAVDRRRTSQETLGAALDALSRCGLSRPDVARFFRKTLASRTPGDRLLAADALAAGGNPAAADLLLGVLADKAWTVRLAAVQGLGKLRVKKTIPPLIARLETEEVVRVRRAAAAALRRITGENLYDIAELWRRWWTEHGEGFEVPEKVPEPKEDAHGGRSVASFYGVPVDSDRVVFVIDRSGSMSTSAGKTTKFARAVAETVGAVAKLGRRARLNVILFETRIDPWQRGLVRNSPKLRAALAKHLEGLGPTGGTNLYDGLEMALLTKHVDSIYLLSDGAPGSGKFVQHEDILREVRKINRTRKIAIHCIALGFDSPLLKALAAQNDGRYVRKGN